MLKRLSSLFYRLASGPLTLAGLVIFLLFTAVVLPAQARKAETYQAGNSSPDTSFFYTKADLYRMAEAYGEAGRRAYVHERFTFDVAWPLAYLFFLGTSLNWSLARLLPEGNRWRLLNLFPAFGWLFDLLENLFASTVMTNYPQPAPVIDSLTPILSLLKWFFVSSSFIILIIALLGIWWNWIRLRKS